MKPVRANGGSESEGFRSPLRDAEAPVPRGQPLVAGAMTRRLHYALFVVLLLLCPVFATDFIVSGGVVPIGYVLFYFLVLYPSWFVLAYWIVVPYVAAFYLLSRLAARRVAEIPVPWRRSAGTVLLGAFVVLSLFPVYRPLSHGVAASKNIIALFRDEYRLSTRVERSGEPHAGDLRAQSRVARLHQHRPAFEDFEAAFERLVLEPAHRFGGIEGDVRPQQHAVHRVERR